MASVIARYSDVSVDETAAENAMTVSILMFGHGFGLKLADIDVLLSGGGVCEQAKRSGAERGGESEC